MCRCYVRRVSPAYRRAHTRAQRGAALTGGVTTSTTARRTIHRTPIRRRRTVALLLVVAVAAALGDQVLASSSPAPERVPAGERRVPRSEHRDPPRERFGAHVLGEADGALPAGTTAFEAGAPGVANLDGALRDALRRAAVDAADDGVTLLVDSGWRSAEYQQHLLDEAIAEYGSREEAARWVASPARSAHVSGDAVDVGPSDAAAWLSQHGAAYGLCQVYGNEPWHYELTPEAPERGCPAPYADPTHDPRLQP